MADIIKCKGYKCPIKKRCKRYTAKEQNWQAWLNGKVNLRTESCKDFLVIK